MSKNLRPEVQESVPGSGGMMDLFDALILTFYNITGSELDEITDKATDQELSDFIDATMEGASIGQIRLGIGVRNQYVDYFKKI